MDLLPTVLFKICNVFLVLLWRPKHQFSLRCLINITLDQTTGKSHLWILNLWSLCYTNANIVFMNGFYFAVSRIYAKLITSNENHMKLEFCKIYGMHLWHGSIILFRMYEQMLIGLYMTWYTFSLNSTDFPQMFKHQKSWFCSYTLSKYH